MDISPSDHFSLRGTLSEAWHRVRGSKLVYFQALLILIAIAMVLAGLRAINIELFNKSQYFLIRTSSLVFGLVLKICESLASLAIIPGLYLIGIRHAAGVPLAPKRILDPLRCIWPFILASLFQGLILLAIALLFVPLYFLGLTPMLVAGAVVLICLMLYLTISLSFVFSLIVAGGHGPLKAVRLSISGVTRHWFKILAIHIISALAVMLGTVTLGIGLIWALPFLFNAHGVAYRNIYGVDPRRLQAIELWR